MVPTPSSSSSLKRSKLMADLIGDSMGVKPIFSVSYSLVNASLSENIFEFKARTSLSNPSFSLTDVGDNKIESFDGPRPIVTLGVFEFYYDSLYL